MPSQLGHSFMLTFLVIASCWPETGLCQEHFLSEVAIKEVENLPRNKGVPDSGHLTVTGLTLWKHTIEDAREKLGLADVIEPGQHYDPYVCYRPAREDDGTVLTLSFNNRGSTHFLTRIQIIAASETFKARNSCTKSLLVSRDLSTQRGIHIGVAPEQVKKILAVRAKETEEYLVATSEYYEEMGKGDQVTCNDTFWMTIARFASAGLTWLEILADGELIRQGHCTQEELAQKR